VLRSKYNQLSTFYSAGEILIFGRHVGHRYIIESCYMRQMIAVKE